MVWALHLKHRLSVPAAVPIHHPASTPSPIRPQPAVPSNSISENTLRPEPKVYKVSYCSSNFVCSLDLTMQIKNFVSLLTKQVSESKTHGNCPSITFSSILLTKIDSVPICKVISTSWERWGKFQVSWKVTNITISLWRYNSISQTIWILFYTHCPH